MTIDMWNTTAINTPSAQLTNLGAAMSLALRAATRPHSRRLCLVFDESYRDPVRRLLTCESVHSTFFTFTFGEPKQSTFGEPKQSTFGEPKQSTCAEPQREQFSVDIDVPATHIGFLDTLAEEATNRVPRLPAAAH